MCLVTAGVMAYNPRLNAVLRAGEQQQRLMGATYSGKPGDNTIQYRNAPTGIDPPNLPKAKSAPSVPAGFTTMKGPAPGKKVLKNDKGDQAFQKSSEVVKDLIREFKQGQVEQEEALRKARAEGEECAKRRVAAIDKYRDEESKAARETVEKLEKMLKDVEASRDSLQNASDESIARIEKMTREGGESSKQVEEMKKTIAQLEAEKTNIQKELDTAKADSNKARDAATAHEAAELAKLAAEWQAKLDKAEKAMLDKSIDAVKGLVEACKGIDPSLN